ncbi:MAG: filamentous hemagglutinin, partial [Pleurocapsa sp.]
MTGDIRLQGKNISLEDSSAIIIQNLGDRSSGTITVNATDSIELSGTVRNSPDITTPLGNITGVTSSRLTTETLGAGTSGNILVSGNNLSLKDGSSIFARSYTKANTGNINIAINESITVNSASILNPVIPTIISTVIFNDGNSGDINISAGNLNILDGGTISALNFGRGQGGDINIRLTEEFKVEGFNSVSFTPSTFGSTAYRTGNSGKITIDTKRLMLLNGGKISSATLAQGHAGQLTINASETIKISGTTPSKHFRSSIASDGEVIRAELRQLLGTPEKPTGDSGNIIITTPNLIVTNGGAVKVSNQGLGNSGSLNINTDRLILDNEASISGFSASGQGGNIDLNVKDNLLLSQTSSISAETMGDSTDSSIDGGNIFIDTDIVTLLENSQINANATKGNGGNINITTQGLFISNNSLISASSEFGLDGNIDVETIIGKRPIELVKISGN